MNEEDKCWMDYELKQRMENEGFTSDLRSFNFSRSTARDKLDVFDFVIDTSQCKGKPWL